MKNNLAAIPIAGLTLALIASPGCLWPCGSLHITAFTWVQEEVFNGFPPEGNYGGYDVEWWNTDDRSHMVNEIRKASRDQHGGVTHVAARWDDNVTWTMSTAKQAGWSEVEVRAEVNKTFEALGLPPPRPAIEGAKVDWGVESC